MNRKHKTKPATIALVQLTSSLANVTMETNEPLRRLKQTRKQCTNEPKQCLPCSRLNSSTSHLA
eukprot:3052770-Pleurochrysis_carterae.AAC.2